MVGILAMNAQNDIKVYITNKDTAVFCCPKCGFSTQKNATQFANMKKAVRIRCKCKCGHVYHAILERRKYIRNIVNIPGTCITTKGNTMHPMLVKDLSRKGLKMEIESRNGLKLGDKLLVEFRLDDKKRTRIRKLATVRSMDGPNVGAEFHGIKPGDPTDQAIRFFLFSLPTHNVS